MTALCRELGITTYRFPGGGSPGWRFRTGVLDKAPEMNGCPLARIEPRGFQPRGPARARVLTGPSLTASNEVRRGTVQIREKAVEGLSVVLPPGSVTLVEIPGG